jgi:adenine-specific DNA-methyltransferase
LEEVFGPSGFRNEIIWKRKGGSANPQNRLGVVTDSILWFSKSDSVVFNQQFTKESDEAKKYIDERFNRVDEKTGRRFMDSPLVSPNPRPNLKYEYKGFSPPPAGWSISKCNGSRSFRPMFSHYFAASFSDSLQ